MARIILTETSTSLCSVALAEDGKVVAYKEDDGRRHASMLAPLIAELLEERQLKVTDCDAVAVSMGPGSYTGLRVGVSSAKGLCFGAGLPLVGVTSTEVLVHQALEGGFLPQGCKYIVPMIDARRMEVYTATYSAAGELTGSICAKVVDGESFSGLLAEGPVLFIGDGALKCREVIASDNAHFVGICPDARGLATPAQREYDEKRFKDIAYFEPFYLKDFVATVSRKKLF